MNKLIVEKRKQEPEKPKETPKPETDTSVTADPKHKSEAGDASPKETETTAPETQPEVKPEPVNFAALKADKKTELEAEISALFKESNKLNGWLHFGHM